MPTTPREQQQFLDLLAQEKTLDFADVLQVFVNKNGKYTQSAVNEVLNFLWNEDLYSVVHRASGKETWLDDEMYRTPEDYQIRFNGFSGKDCLYSESYAGEVDKTDVEKLARHYHWVGAKQREVIRVIGDLKGSMIMAERVRAFTHYFAFNLITRNLEKLEAMFSSKVRDSQNAEAIYAKINNLENQHGVAYEYFDHVEVIAVYNGKHGDAKVSEQMPLPPGVDRSARRGESAFKLVSVHTPNGVAVHDYIIYLAIIEEEDGLFKVSKTDMFSGY